MLKKLLTVKAKLRMVFALFFIMVCSLAFYNNSNLKELKRNMNHISMDIIPQQKLLDEINAAVDRFRMLEASDVISTPPEDDVKYEAEMKKNAAAIEDDAKKFLNSDISEKEKQHIDEFLAEWNRYLDINKRLIAISHEFTSPENVALFHQSATIYQTESKESFQKLDKITDELVEDISQLDDETSDHINKFVASSIRNGLIAMAIAAVISVIMVIMFERTVLRNLLRITARMQQLSKGDNSVVIEGANRPDEIGDMAKSLEVFKENALATERMEREQKQEEIAAEEEKKAMMHKLASDFETGVQGIITTVAAAATQLYQTAESMQKTVTTVSDQSATAGMASVQTSSNVQSVSAAVEEMSASVKEIASQMAKSAALVTETVTQTQQADKTTQLLADAVTQISGILELIQNIAGQINLLALNATIESARAGDAGKGFAVVASEVKNLAGQTTKATEEIAKQIANVQQASKDVVEVLKTIQGAIHDVNQYSSAVASAVEEQSSVTREISSNMQTASDSVQNITSNISDISKGASNANHAAAEVLTAAQRLSKQSELLNQQVKSFLDGVRAA